MPALPFAYQCSVEAGFVMDPNAHARFGYLTDLGGIGLPAPLAKDLVVAVAYAGTPSYPPLGYVPGTPGRPGTAKVAGVVESLAWGGGPTDPIQIACYLSQQNASKLRAVQVAPLRTTVVSAVGWWVADYDPGTRQWFEQAFPVTPAKPAAALSRTGSTDSGLAVDLSPRVVKDGIDVNVYRVTIAVAPSAGHPSLLQFATSATRKVVKQWGT